YPIATSSLTVVSQPSRGGTVTVNTTTGRASYTPALNFYSPTANDTDVFTYRICDIATVPNCTDPTQVAIRVNSVNDAPVAEDYSVQTDEDTPVSVQVI